MNTIVRDMTGVKVTFPPLSGNVPSLRKSEPIGVEDLLLGSLQSPVVRLKHELRLKVRRSHTAISVLWEEAEITAEGGNLMLAIDRFRRHVVAEFLRLKSAGELSPILADAMYEGRP